MNFKKYLIAFAASAVLVSCNSDDDNGTKVENQAFDNGTFVLNEGNSNVSSASVTFIGDNSTVQQDIYNTVNPGKPGLGSYLQSIFFTDDLTFIISGSANKVTVVNRHTFEFVANVDTNFSSPRYGAVVNGKAYITNYADYNTGDDDFLTVINLTDFTTSKIQLNNWSEKITEENGKLYIFNGYYGSGTSVTVFNPANNTVEKVIELNDSPNSFDEEDGILYVLGDSKLSKINLSNNTIAGTVTLPEALLYSKNLTIEDDKIYFTNDTSVYTMGVNATTLPVTPLFSYVSTSAYGGMYGFNVEDDKIYVAEGGDFASNSQVFTFSLTGSLLGAYNVGVGPNGFYFN
ncbi:DUF5074 domain-containing protein [Flavobacterium subsaxonicum]|uniref:Lipoprotein n=1 Tax=Flavobacterium subsaxonicum WB 4.1-42 = DSM 21790 TaxID=1121898 RepID=A0A0A2ML81_9FLAO|nr:DUF5074 domain-containing protein [Flavobacterium subsaxonicum]KGO93069.1 hypothetical protein Q766_10675 [Flavobacterium subsaxonicum WB 4.1-42 = DSM 21790]